MGRLLGTDGKNNEIIVDDGLSIVYGLENAAAIDNWSADDRAPASPKVASVCREERQDFDNAIVGRLFFPISKQPFVRRLSSYHEAV